MITPVAPVAASALQRRLGDDEEAEQLVTSGPQVWSPVGSRTSRNGFGYGSTGWHTYCIIRSGNTGRCLYYVLYCIKIIRVLYLYYVLCNPVANGSVEGRLHGKVGLWPPFSVPPGSIH